MPMPIKKGTPVAITYTVRNILYPRSSFHRLAVAAHLCYNPLMAPEHISKEVMRRYVLGRQGLWPGRRWGGVEGAAQAIRQIGALQLDPLVIVARSHDLTLHSRVARYRPEQLDQLLYTERQFF